MKSLVVSRFLRQAAIYALVTVLCGTSVDGSALDERQQVSFSMDDVDGSGVRGVARVEASGVDQVYVLLVMNSATGGETAVARTGTCDAPGENSFSLHNIDAGGYSGTFVDGVTYHQLIQEPHAIVVFGVGADSSKIVSCAEIEDGAIAPFVLTVTMERVVLLDSALGIVTAHGSVVCSGPGDFDVFIHLEQRVKRELVSGDGAGERLACDGLSATAWVVQVSGSNGTFTTRPAAAYVSVTGCGRDYPLCDQAETLLFTRLVEGS